MAETAEHLSSSILRIFGCSHQSLKGKLLGKREIKAFLKKIFVGLSFRGLSFRGLSFRGLSFRGLSFRGLSFRGLRFRYTLQLFKFISSSTLSEDWNTKSERRRSPRLSLSVKIMPVLGLPSLTGNSLTLPGLDLGLCPSG